MAMLSFCGIDVSKDRLDVVVLPEGWFFSVSNDTTGWAELVVRLRPLAVSAIGLEPSGGYERGIIRALLAARGQQPAMPVVGFLDGASAEWSRCIDDLKSNIQVCAPRWG